jgi:probable DNA metabolism protein
MSEYPIEGDIIRFGWRVLSAAREAGAVFGIASPEARAAAGRVSTDRGDRGTETVLKAAYRVSREIHRLMGFLRFTRDARGRYLARCAPDHFILPCLAAHLSRRFGAETWAVIDEKRGLTLLGLPGEGPRLLPAETRRTGNPPASPVPRTAGFPRPDPGNPPAEPREPPPDDPWEELWRNYHRSINNGDRKNPGLQLRFMPLRYWKYLPEMNFQSPGDAARRD